MSKDADVSFQPLSSGLKLCRALSVALKAELEKFTGKLHRRA